MTGVDLSALRRRALDVQDRADREAACLAWDWSMSLAAMMRALSGLPVGRLAPRVFILGHAAACQALRETP